VTEHYARLGLPRLAIKWDPKDVARWRL
jgi:hypothetical protein